MSSENLRASFAEIMRTLETTDDRQSKALINSMELIALEINHLAVSLKVVPDQLKDVLGLLRDLERKVAELSPELDE